MIDQAVILAVEKGPRIRGSDGEDDLPAALHVVAGLTLVKRAILTLARGGVTRVHVVTGGEGERLRAVLADDPAYARAGVAIDFIENPDPERDGGASVLEARGRVDGPFLLTRSDHVYDPSVVRLAAASDMSAADLYLCIDRRSQEVHDPGRATKVRSEDGRIVDVGETLSDFDGVACGVLAVGPAFLDSLAAVHAELGPCAQRRVGRKDDSLWDGVRRLATAGRARVADVGTALCRDGGTAGARARAEDELFAALRKPTDGPMSKLLNRRLSLAVTRLLAPTRVTPNQMTVVGNAIGLFGVYLVFQATWWSVAVGAVLVQTQSVLDGCDGELARLKFQSSRFGEWLDLVLDNIVNSSYGLALGYASASLFDLPILVWAGVVGAAGAVLYDLNMYVQLAVVRKSGNEMLFRWWFQKEDEDNLTQSLAKDRSPVMAALHGLVRRDVFLFCFMLLALARLPAVAALWYGALGAGYLVLVVLHVALGGVRLRAREAR